MDEGSREAQGRRFVTLRAVAEMLSVEESDIEGLLDSGELPGIRIGARGEWRIEQSVLESYLEAKYEESRRAALFRGFDHASLADLDGVRRQRPASPHSPA